MSRKLRSLMMPALAAAGLAWAATATLAQRDAPAKSTIYGDFVKLGDQFIRISAIDGVAYRDGRVILAVGTNSAAYEPEECAELLRLLKLPRVEASKPKP